jgi:hypothetical protein
LSKPGGININLLEAKSFLLMEIPRLANPPTSVNNIYPKDGEEKQQKLHRNRNLT